MPYPTVGDVHVNSMCGKFSVAYIQKATAFAAEQVFANIPVNQKSDRYSVWDKGDLLRDEMTERNPGTESAGVGIDVDTTPNYSCRVYGLHQDVDDQTRANSDSILGPDKIATIHVTQKALIKKDAIFASKFMNSGIWSFNQVGVPGAPAANQFKQWDQLSGTTIIRNVETWKEMIAGGSGVDPNAMLIAPDVMPVLKTAQEIKDTIQYSSGGVVTEELLARLFGVEKVVVPKTVVNTAAKGATIAPSRMFSKKILLAYANPNPGIEEPSAGYNFSWTGLYGNSKWGSRIKKFRIERLESDRVEIGMSFDMKVVCPDLGCYCSAVIA